MIDASEKCKAYIDTMNHIRSYIVVHREEALTKLHAATDCNNAKSYGSYGTKDAQVDEVLEAVAEYLGALTSINAYTKVSSEKALMELNDAVSTNILKVTVNDVESRDYSEAISKAREMLTNSDGKAESGP